MNVARTLFSYNTDPLPKSHTAAVGYAARRMKEKGIKLKDVLTKHDHLHTTALCTSCFVDGQPQFAGSRTSFPEGNGFLHFYYRMIQAGTTTKYATAQERLQNAVSMQGLNGNEQLASTIKFPNVIGQNLRAIL